MGRPKKDINLLMGEPTKKKLKLFLNEAKEALKAFIDAEGELEIGLTLSSSIDSPKPVSRKSKKYNKIEILFRELFEKDSSPPIKEVLQLLKEAESIRKDVKLSKLIKEAEAFVDSTSKGKPKKAEPEATKPAKKAKK